MTLETTLKALELSTQDRLSEIDQTLLEEGDVRSILTAYFTECETRPSVVSAIRVPELLYEYLSLPLSDRVELEQFNREFPEYLLGNGDNGSSKKTQNQKVRSLVQKCAWTYQLVQQFDMYLAQRNPFQLFNTGFVRDNKCGKKLHNNAKNTLKHLGGFDYLVQLAAKVRPEIQTYTIFKGVLKIDGVQQILELFDYFGEHRQEGDVFNQDYIRRDPNLKRDKGNIGQNLYASAKDNFKENGGLQHLIDLAAEQRSEVRDYTSKAGILKVDGPRIILRNFEKFLRSRNRYAVFRVTKNSGEGDLVYRQAQKYYKDKGGIDYIMELACQEDSRIKEYLSMEAVVKKDAPEEIIEEFRKWLQRRKPYETFNAKVLGSTTKGRSILSRGRNHLGAWEGFRFLLGITQKLEPEIMKYSTFEAVLREDGPKQFVDMFNFYMENREEGEVFDSSYLRTNKRLREEFSTAGAKLYENALHHFKEQGGIQFIIELAGRDNPELLQHWKYVPRK